VASPGASLEPYLIRVKYLSAAFDVVDVDDTGSIKIQTFLKAVKRVPKIDGLLKKGRNKKFNGEDAEERAARVFATLERDKKLTVSKEEFIKYFVLE
jgi:Ca2+-binding EF-hand superfamily protein